MPRNLSEMIQAGLPTMTFGDNAQRAGTFVWDEEVGNSLVLREPVGVVGAITPWNYPLHQIANKVAPALAAGCTVVLKPSEVAPINAFILAEIIDEAGLPKGVFNLVTGVGPVVGEAIASHPLVDMVSFTGSTRAGKRVMELASQTRQARLARARRQVREHHPRGRRPRSTADPERACSRCYLNSGPDLLGADAHARPAREARRGREARGGDGRDASRPATRSPRRPPRPARLRGAAATRVARYITKGVDEGAKLVTGGPEQPEGLDKGYFVRPTVFSNVTNDMTIAREEIFGPVLSIIPYDTEEEAIEIANDTPYGLAGGVWAGTQERAIEIAQRLRTGQVDVNGGSFNPFAPFGGYKQSGIGRELGKFGFEEFLEIKSIQR